MQLSQKLTSRDVHRVVTVFVEPLTFTLLPSVRRIEGSTCAETIFTSFIRKYYSTETTPCNKIYSVKIIDLNLDSGVNLGNWIMIF